MRKFVKTILSLTIILSLLPTMTVSADYSRYTAINYAKKYAEGKNGAYYYFDDVDCTNFVSQCIAHAGIVSYAPSTLPSVPLVKEYKLDTTSNVWYMVKKKNKIGLNCWIYSKTWSCVTDFRKYFQGNYNEGSNDCATVRSYGISSWDKMLGELKEGDVLQYDSGNNRHSIIITKVPTSGSVNEKTIQYCGHTDHKKDEPLSTFIDYVKEEKINVIVRISFE